ncbi:hypothetical protein SAY86_000097 [Trapa natans]|uniref:BHLH domain-containing protein n=1 Tax=Trapa natans TaxID=22666 RepID=A0AAN7MAA1_TRANT|nr:hypothetical protein SAY86_000097 [Trapa natans]
MLPLSWTASSLLGRPTGTSLPGRASSASPVAEPLATDPVGGGGGGSSCAHIEQRNPSECIKKRKTVHRDVERQRRQEMASLYGSLRSHLPVNYSRYIENRQSNIQELVAKRDKLKRMSESEKTDGPELADREEDPRTRRPSYIGGIEPCAGGIEITISIDPPHGTALSKYFQCDFPLEITDGKHAWFHGLLQVTTGNNKSSAYDLSELKNKLMRLSG